MKNFVLEQQEIITGSSRLVKNQKNFDRTKYASDNMNLNLAYIENLKKHNTKDEDENCEEKTRRRKHVWWW